MSNTLPFLQIVGTNFVFLGFLVMSGLALAENSTPFPSPPYLTDPGDSAQWTIHAMLNSEATEGQIQRRLPFAVSQSIRRAGASRHDVVEMNSGEKYERWLFMGYELVVDPTTDDLSLRFRAPENTAEWNNILGLEDLLWVNEATEKSWSKFQNNICLLFEADIPDPVFKNSSANESNGGSGLVRVRAWIDPETRLPVAFFDGRHTMIYNFGTSPAAPFTLPTSLQDKLNRYRERQKSLF